MTAWSGNLEDAPQKYEAFAYLTSTILGQKVAEHVLEAVYVRAGYILGILFVLLIKKYYVLSYFILFYFISFYFILYYLILFHFIDFIFI